LNPDASSSSPLAIIGIGCLFPGAPGFRAFWSRIQTGADAITEVPPTHWRAEDYYHPDPKAPDRVYACRGGFLEPVPFSPAEFGIAPNNLEAIDTAQLLGLIVARQALEDAGYAAEPGTDTQGLRALDRRRVSVILGVTGTLELVIPLGARLGHPIWRRALREAGVADAVADDVVRRIGDAYVGWQENSFPGLLGNVVAGRIANRFDLGGTNCVVDAACASSLGAVHLAALELQSGRADMVLTGGVDTFNDVFMYMCFSKTPALSPTGDARPFDVKADGTVLGEGVGMVVLKRLSDAQRDGDRIYAVLSGMGTASDGRGGAVYAPRVEGQTEALQAAYRLAGVTPDTIELIEAHGTGTRVGDAAEADALADVYRASGRQGSWCALGSVKSQIGHTKAAAGVAGLIKVAAALYHKVLPPTAKVTEPIEAVRPGRGPLYVNTECRPWLPSPSHPRRAAVSAFGFGGSNFHCVLEEADPIKHGIDWDGDVQIQAISANSVDELRARLIQVPRPASWQEFCARATQSRADWDPPQPYRLLLVAQRGKTDLDKLFESACSFMERRSAKTPPRGVFFGNGPPAGKLAVLFPGQGAQYTGMFRDLACRFPTMQKTLGAADEAFRAAAEVSAGPALSTRIYPPPAFTAEERARREALLRDTAAAQPALGAVCLGAWRTLQVFGVRVDAAAGHSYGELPALCAAGLLTERDFHTLSILRGSMMAAASAEPGAMLAVKAAEPAIRQVLSEERLELVLANKNTPQQTVLSGLAAEVARAEEAFTRRSMAARRLAVATAFHSPLVESATQPFRTALEGVSLGQGSMPVYANTTAAPYPAAQAEARELLAGQLANTVEWLAEVKALYADGIRIFLDVGPSRKVSGMIEAILRGREHNTVALDASEGRWSGVFDLACCLASLAALGHEVRLDAWDPGEGLPAADTGTDRPTLVVPLCGANYVKPRPLSPPAPATRSEADCHPTPNGESMPNMNGVGPRPQTTSPVAERSQQAGVPTPPLPESTALSQALQVTRESLAALQKMQEQTAQLQRQFLEGQEAAQRTVQVLVEQQQRLLQASLGWLPTAPVVPPPAPSPPVPRPEPLAAPATNLAPPSPPLPRTQPVEGILLAVVAEKTGYPPEMLELDMALDADLGIDSIKRVEILSALQERLPEAPAVKPEHLGSLHTLRQVADFLAGAEAVSGPPSANKIGMAPAAVNGKTTEAVLLAVVAEKTGYPPEMLELDMALDADLGIDSIKRVEILSALQERLPDSPTVKPEHLGSLHTLRQVAEFLAHGAEQAPASVNGGPQRPFERAGSVINGVPPATGQTLNWSVVRPVPLEPRGQRERIALAAGGEVWITPEGSPLTEAIVQRFERLGFCPRAVCAEELASRPIPPMLAGVLVLAPAAGVGQRFLRDVLRGMRHMSKALRGAGRHGQAVFLTLSRLDGAFGLARLDPNREPLDGGLAGLAKTAAHEWPEVGCKALDLAEDLDCADAADQIVEEMFFTGPAEVGLSATGRCTLQHVAEPLPNDATQACFKSGDVIVLSGGARGITAETAIALAGAFRPIVVLLGRSVEPVPEPDWLQAFSGEANLKRALAAHSMQKLSLKELEERYQQVAASREIRTTLARIEEMGGKAIYRSVDVRNATAVAETLSEVRREFGPVRGLIHGAGVLADARIEEKTDEQFERVWATKVTGLENLLVALVPEELRALVLFSSSTARFGRTGQVDYAIANEVLNKQAHRYARQLDGCRVLSINWGPWDGGMVSSGLKKVFEAEGIGLINPAAGAEFLVQSLGSTKTDVEVVVLAPNPAPRTAALPAAFEQTLHLADFPVLSDHVLDGRPVVPMALILEWLAHAALHANPGLVFHGCDEFRILHGVVLDGVAPVVRAGAARATRRDGLFVAPVELRGRHGDGREVLHARAEVLLAANLPEAPAAGPIPTLDPYAATPAEIYADQLFHGPLLHAFERVDGCGPGGIAAWVRAAPPPSEWLRRPLRQKWLADPLVLDAGFQLLILWSLAQKGTPGLPAFGRRYRQFRRTFPASPVRIVARISRATALHAIADLDYLDSAGQVIARMEGYECVLDSSLKRAFARRQMADRLPVS
jgi:acyl transferase domain-containing protein/acyl carrier protein